MSHEFEDYADIEGERGLVTVTFDVDGYKPLGLWVSNEYDVDVTELLSVNEYDRLYAKACELVADEIMGDR
jgi:hypothetical protein